MQLLLFHGDLFSFRFPAFYKLYDEATAFATPERIASGGTFFCTNRCGSCSAGPFFSVLPEKSMPPEAVSLTGKKAGLKSSYGSIPFQLLQFIQRQPEAIQKMLHKIIQTRQLHLLERKARLLCGGLELGVPGLQVLEALDVR